jgi:hypothetical protein
MSGATRGTNPTTQAACSLHQDLLPLKKEILAYRHSLPRLVAEGHEGRFALIKGDEVLGIWDTFDDAYEAGRDRFGFAEPFLAQPIQARDLSRWPEDLNPPQAG